MRVKKIFLAAILFSLWGLGGLHAQSVIDSGFCGANAGGGTNLTWTLYSDSTLLINGSGDMDSYWDMFTGLIPRPWSNYYNLIKTVIIGDSVTFIGDNVFFSCTSLISVSIGNSVTSIDFNAFYYCTGLTSVSIGNGIISIGYKAFSDCSNLTFLTVYAVTPPAINNTTFLNVPDTIPIYVPCGSIQAYRDSAGWNYFSNYIGFMDTTFIYDTVCPNIVYNSNGFNVPAIAGTYYDTLQNTNGCDSIIELNLVVYAPSVLTQISDSICAGSSYNFGSRTLTEDGIYYDTLQTINGCDSIIELNLAVHVPSVLTQISDSICAGGSYNFGSRTLTEDGIYYDTLQTINGCDSIIELTLTVSSVGIVETDNYPSLRVYPNPTTGQLTISLPNPSKTSASLSSQGGANTAENIEIYDVVGQRVHRHCEGFARSNPENNNENTGLLHSVRNDASKVVLDISHLASGMYFLKIDNQVIKFIKE